MATLLTLGYSLEDLINSVSALQGVCGRMEMIKVEGKPAIIVDYAHTPDALEKHLLQHVNIAMANYGAFWLRWRS
ncbi:UDP-N-acetylmuramoyl-L-alanyl-D-glutamate--2, 6-diaminopimelate ligase [Rodentibacter pneumotropicus]|uniref:UDP-N-acetylmuramoyl-L-alanyl-D-glutamate--2, 6-diaminopimelate ligase n=1 Tax=Rodentibacter pneumotropicus TaxID=758 RepID=A0A448MS10_9PAST|nr:UDP-N-acetylmuramoyl-L-alanyl-D-glutamate--2, 6-diaminopimelate ligase [Rodentibacter pneumotropicus]